MSVHDILKAIRKVNSVDEIRMINDTARLRFRDLISMEAVKFDVGDKVTFDSRNGETIKGKIMRVGRKTITVWATNNQMWRVSPVFLKKL